MRTLRLVISRLFCLLGSWVVESLCRRVVPIVRMMVLRTVVLRVRPCLTAKTLRVTVILVARVSVRVRRLNVLIYPLRVLMIMLFMASVARARVIVLLLTSRLRIFRAVSFRGMRLRISLKSWVRAPWADSSSVRVLFVYPLRSLIPRRRMS